MKFSSKKLFFESDKICFQIEANLPRGQNQFSLIAINFRFLLELQPLAMRIMQNKWVVPNGGQGIHQREKSRGHRFTSVVYKQVKAG